MPVFRIGYEIGSGEEVTADLHHLAIFGLTQKSGKTTSLEAFINRINGNASTLIFRTGKGEIGFHDAKEIPFFFRERVDWEFIEGLISAHLQEKAKVYRADIMRASKGATDLQGFWKNIRSTLGKTREGSWTNKILTELDQYFSEIIPALRSIHFSKDLEVGSGTYVMDLETVRGSLQQLIIASSVDRIMEKHSNVIVVLPEARDFIPEDRKAPVKLSIENLIRKGAKLGNYLWLDSQSLTGLDMDVMRNIGTWLFGRQDLDLEAERSAKMIPRQNVRYQEIESLGIGQFYFRQGDTIQKIYVQPAWMDEKEAVDTAKGLKSVVERNMRTGDNEMDQKLKIDNDQLKAENEGLRRQITGLQRTVESLEREIKAERSRNPEARKSELSGPPAPERIELEAKEVQVSVTKLEPDVRSFSTKTVSGKILFTLVEDLSNAESLEEDIHVALKERGWNVIHQTLAPELGKLVKAGTLIKGNEKPARYRIPGKLKIKMEEQS